MSLKRLAKLRQFNSAGDVVDYLSNDLRQNLLAIENALQDGIAKDYLFGVIPALSVPNNNSLPITLSDKFKIDTFSLYSASSFNIKEDGSYLLDLSFFNMLVNGVKTISLNVYVGGVLTETFILIEQTSAGGFGLTQNFSFPIALKKSDKLILKLVNESTYNTNVLTVDSGIIKISKLKL